jgi:group I intron endonuclease
LEYCEPSDVISREQYYLNLFKPDYNILTTAGSTQGYKHSKETLAKLKGRKHSSETREKLKIHLTKLNKVLNEKKGIKVEIFDLETNITNTYESIAKAARAINTQSKALLTIEKSELGSGIIKPYKGRYLITILRNVTKLSSLCDMPQKVELARQNIAIARTK